MLGCVVMNKVLFVTNIPTPYRVNFFNLLSKTVDLTVIFEAKYAKNIRFSQIDWETIKFKTIFLSENNIREKTINFSILKEFKREKYNTIFVTNYSYFTELFFLMWLRLKGRKYILEIDGPGKVSKNILKSIVKKFAIKGSTNVFSPSKLTDEYLVKHGCSMEKIIRYPFTSVSEKDIVNIDNLVKVKNINKHRLRIKKPIVLSVGQFVYRKGFDQIIIIAKKFPQFHFIIIGGEPTIEYSKLIDNNNIVNVTFMDFMNQERLKEIYLASDIFILPTRFDVWGLVINEAMAQGLPIISTTSCGAARELVFEDKNGFLYKSDNLNELYNCITKLDSLPTRKKMASNAIDIIKNYTLEKMVKVHEEFIKKT